MRSTHKSTAQTTCDGGDGFCPEFVLSSFFDRVPPEQRPERHRKAVAEEGWTDLEGRDYCPDYRPTAAHNAQTRSTQ
ncbi:hypothetical protein [Streptomyces sp. NPDC086838]|uniref:hypothetical protein n=1 Tax=Streptomyces sp. NPDC086838 TaxID=3365762 RepID=UPI0038284CE9